jgi:hypothetical protein
MHSERRQQKENVHQKLGEEVIICQRNEQVARKVIEESHLLILFSRK